MKTDADLWGGYLAQGTVVITFSPSQTVPLVVERDTGYDNQVDLSQVDLLSSDWFQDVIGPFADASLALIAKETEIVARDDWQEKSFLAIPTLNKRSSSRLVGQGMVESDPFRLAKKVALLDPGDNLIR